VTVTVAVVGQPRWAAVVETLASRHSWRLIWYDGEGPYVARLVEDGAALILVDAQQPGWRARVTAARTNPATRRIAVIVVATDDAARHAAYDAGAAMVLLPDELAAALPKVVMTHARLPDPARRAWLEHQCGEPLPPEAREAVRLFNAGDYYRQHDLFEALWMAEDGPVRELYRAILQVGIAYYQITRGNRRGALKMLLRSVQWLASLPDVCQGVDVKQLREDAARVRTALEKTDPAAMAAFDLSLLRPVRLVDDSPQ